jgi:hypothetical protein
MFIRRNGCSGLASGFPVCGLWYGGFREVHMLIGPSDELFISPTASCMGWDNRLRVSLSTLLSDVRGVWFVVSGCHGDVGGQPSFHFYRLNWELFRVSDGLVFASTEQFSEWQKARGGMADRERRLGVWHCIWVIEKFMRQSEAEWGGSCDDNGFDELGY